MIFTAALLTLGEPSWPPKDPNYAKRYNCVEEYYDFLAKNYPAEEIAPNSVGYSFAAYYIWVKTQQLVPLGEDNDNRGRILDELDRVCGSARVRPASQFYGPIYGPDQLKENA